MEIFDCDRVGWLANAVAVVCFAGFALFLLSAVSFDFVLVFCTKHMCDCLVFFVLLFVFVVFFCEIDVANFAVVDFVLFCSCVFVVCVTRLLLLYCFFLALEIYIYNARALLFFCCFVRCCLLFFH